MSCPALSGKQFADKFLLEVCRATCVRRRHLEVPVMLDNRWVQMRVGVRLDGNVWLPAAIAEEALEHIWSFTIPWFPRVADESLAL